MTLMMELRPLVSTLATGGWSRAHGMQLMRIAQHILDQYHASDWLEVIGRAEALVEILSTFIRETPSPQRLVPVLRSASALADLLDQGPASAHIDPALLPIAPNDWIFECIDDQQDSDTSLLASLRSLGFEVEETDDGDAWQHARRPERHVLLADAAWLATRARRLAPPPGASDGSWLGSRVVGLFDHEDRATLLAAARNGAELLLARPLTTEHLLSELAGLAWMPRLPYQALLVDETPDALTHLAEHLRTDGFEVIATDDALEALHLLEERPPDVCVLGPPASTGATAGLAVLLRRQTDASRVPLIELVHGERLAQPLGESVLRHARAFRRRWGPSGAEGRIGAELAELKDLLDQHASLSLTTPDGAILDVNARFCELSGYRRDELIGRNHRLIKSGRHLPALAEDLWHTISNGDTWRGELENRRKDGRPYWVQATIVPICNAQGQIEHYASICTDISRQKRLMTEQQRQTRLLDQQRQALQQFIATQDIADASTHLLDGLLSLTESQHGFILEVCRDADQAPFLKPQAISGIAWSPQTHHLLAAAKAEGMEFRNLDRLFGTILHTREAIVVDDLTEYVHQIQLPHGHPSLQTFVGVPMRDQESVVAILGLANRPGGYGPSEIDLIERLSSTYVSLLNAAHIQDAQQQVLNGLKAGQGTMAPFQPPAHPSASTLIAEHQPTAQPPARAGESSARHRILIAEDHLPNQTLLRMQIEMLGHAVEVASDGASALAKWKAGGYDLLLTDLKMPGMDGLSLTRSIRAAEQEQGGHLPIFAITGTEESEVLAACRNAGMDEILSKPIELEDLRRRLAQWLSGAARDTTNNPAASPSASTADAVLDTAYITSILGDIGQAQIRDLIDLFTATAHAELRGCRNLRRASDMSHISSTMHQLKSSARMVGALQFATLAERLETAVETGAQEESVSLLAALEYAIDDVETAAERLMAAPTPSLAATQMPPTNVPCERLPERVFVVDDDPLARRQISLILEALGVREILTADSGERALAELERAESERVDLLITDLNMPAMDGVEFLRGLAAHGYRGELIISSGVDAQLVQTAADLARAKGLQLRGAIKKPMTRDALARLLTLAPNPPRSPQSVMSGPSPLSASDLLEGIRTDAFSMHFQPKVDTRTLRVVGVEALARWQHDGAAIPPGLFIEIAERNCLIAPLSRLLLTKTLRGGAELAAAGFALSVSFNLSPLWLSDINLPELIVDLAQTSGFPPDRLILEITETSLLEDPDTSLDVLTRLRLKGIKLSIDDFGTGYATMEQLQRLPVSELKIDRGFVQGAAERPTVRAILAASVDMARKLRLTTVAEGVETQADLDLMRGLGCDVIQGWLIARAMPIEALLIWLRARAGSP